MKYALLDWDKTLKHNYTLLTWVDYLIRIEILPNSILKELYDLDRLYREEKISHDEYAKKACIIYSEAITGLSEKILSNAAINYVLEGNEHFFPFVENLFSHLKENNILPIIISGSPLCVIQQFKEKFNIHAFYAFSPEVKNGVYTGKVKSNYGYNKESIVKKIQKKFNQNPCYAFGDSLSDLPLLKSADQAYIIYYDTPNINLNNAIYINNQSKKVF